MIRKLQVRSHVRIHAIEKMSLPTGALIGLELKSTI